MQFIVLAKYAVQLVCANEKRMKLMVSRQ